MNKEQLNILKEFEELFFNCFDSHIRKFSNQITVEIVNDSANSSWIRVVLHNHGRNKKLEWSFSNGINENGNKINGLMFFISYGEQSFSIQEYCTFCNIGSPISEDLYVDENELINKAGLYLNEVLEFLKKDELDKILYSDYWVEVPRDFSPYK